MERILNEKKAIYSDEDPDEKHDNTEQDDGEVVLLTEYWFLTS